MIFSVLAIASLRQTQERESTQHARTKLLDWFFVTYAQASKQGSMHLDIVSEKKTRCAQKDLVVCQSIWGCPLPWKVAVLRVLLFKTDFVQFFFHFGNNLILTFFGYNSEVFKCPDLSQREGVNS